MQFLMFLIFAPFLGWGRSRSRDDDNRDGDNHDGDHNNHASGDDHMNPMNDDDDDGDMMPVVGNDPAGPGEAGQTLLRLGDANYTDGVGAIDDTLPNAREISNAVAQQEGDMPNSMGLSDMFWAWGQFIDHDLGLTPGGEGESIPIAVPEDDPEFAAGSEIPFHRIAQNEGTGVDSPREFENELTSTLDASMVYGVDSETQDAVSACPYLSMQQNALPRDENGDLIAGDVRAAENVALTSMHEMFAREHNRLAHELEENNPDMTDDEIFDGARLRLEIEIQSVTFNEWLPLLVGEDAIADYEGYDPDVDPGISVEFSGAAFRFGHTMLSSQIERLNEDGSDIEGGALSLREAFFNPDILVEGGGIDPVLRGLAGSHAQEIDTQIVEDVRSFLFEGDDPTRLDLAALNIMRGRDLGIESYNDLRETLGFERAEAFSDITSDADVAARLEMAYGDIDDVDAWVGGLAEDPVEGGAIGETFAFIIVDQFTRLRDGDATWGDSEGEIPADELAELQSTTLADIIQNTTGIEALQDDVFLAHERIGGTEEGDVLVGSEIRDLIFGLSGDDTLDGAEGDDVLLGGDGDDVILGGEGDDKITGGAGDDMLTGGEGNDNFLFDGASGTDVILDFAEGDIISLDLEDDENFDPSLLQETDDGVLITLADGTSVTVAEAVADEVAAAIVVV